MKLEMNDSELKSPMAIRSFLNGTCKVNFEITKAERYSWLAKTLKQTGYFQLCKKDKSVVREYMSKMTGYSRQQLTRLIRQYREKRWIGRATNQKYSFSTQYTREDILLLAKTDECHNTLSGGATKKLFERGYVIFKEPAYERLSTISISHIYNFLYSQKN